MMYHAFRNNHSLKVNAILTRRPSFSSQRDLAFSVLFFRFSLQTYGIVDFCGCVFAIFLM